MIQKLWDLELKTHVMIHTAMLVLGAMVTAIGAKISSFGSLHPVAWIGLLVIAAGLIWRLIIIKCPYCGSGLYGVRSLPQHCPDCGEKLF